MKDAIEKSIVLKAPLARVWEAISDSRQFGAWFGAEVDGAFEAGRTLQCRIQPTTVDPAIAKAQERWAGMPFEVVVERVEPQVHLSFRWHPGAEGPESDSEPMTLVSFDLSEVEGGTRLDITESGFDRIPLARRAKAFADNEGGWAAQCGLIEKYLARHG